MTSGSNIKPVDQSTLDDYVAKGKTDATAMGVRYHALHAKAYGGMDNPFDPATHGPAHQRWQNYFEGRATTDGCHMVKKIAAARKRVPE